MVLKKNCVKFHKRGDGVLAFLLVNLKGFFFWYFELSKSLIFFLSFGGLEFPFFLCEVSQARKWKPFYVPFFLWTLKSFISVFWNSKIFSFLLVILKALHGGKYCWVYCFKIWEFSTLFLWSSKIIDFVLGNFRGVSQKQLDELELVVSFCWHHLPNVFKN